MTTENNPFSRRRFLAGTGLLLAGTVLKAKGAGILENASLAGGRERIIDIHQHTDYTGRPNEQLISHQRTMGISTTILLPAGSPVVSASTHQGVSNGLQAGCTGNEVCYRIAQEYPDEFVFGSNEVPDLPGAVKEIEKYLKLGAKVIGELKFGVDCDSPEMQRIYELAGKYEVPVLMHWQHKMYSYHLERFHKMLEKYPEVNFIGHAQTWWANVDKNHEDQSVLYPETKVAAGGITDRLLSDYPNMYGDLSAGSGLNSLLRDEAHAREFLERHQDKLLYGSDCNDSAGQGERCIGAKGIDTIRRLSSRRRVERKILYKNAKKLFRI
ncbi:amidohydrolase family protein [Anseongella ginsenosidimutans]|nr:amidohydrolase family protein [Anseongella ginsenosidimutans]QEC52199.1 amidohydrolase family protein [Anseongella ginsenosidimutans]